MQEGSKMRRRLSSLLIPGNNNNSTGKNGSPTRQPPPPVPQIPTSAERTTTIPLRPESRGRTPGKLTKESRTSSAHFGSPSRINTAKSSRPTTPSTPKQPGTPNRQPTITTTQPSNSYFPSSEDVGNLPPPRFPQEGGGGGGGGGSNSNPPSRSSSRPPSRSSSPKPGSPVIRNPQEEPPPPLLGPPRTRTFSVENEKKLKRKSWIPGSRARSKSNSTAEEQRLPRAWILAKQINYDVAPLAHGQRVTELWDENGNTFVHLFPKSAGKGPSFRVHSDIFADSATLTQLAFGNIYSQRQAQSDAVHKRGASESWAHSMVTSPTGAGGKPSRENGSSGSSSRGTRETEQSLEEPPRQISLYVPILSGQGALSSSKTADGKITKEDVEALIEIRNVFAFLIGQSLIATDRRPTAFSVFLKIAETLKTYGFSNLDGSSFGEQAATSFDEYTEEFALQDVRLSREQTIESIVLGERMRSVMLYNEAFIHAVGKYSDIIDVTKRGEPRAKFEMISAVTRSRMERASIDLAAREKSTNSRLVDFEFPSLFAGIASSKTTDARKTIRFGVWKEAFFATRKHVLSYYKSKYGSWPPKARSKKNALETSGLNRVVLQELYHDCAELYDLLVDRTLLTIRSNNDMLADEFIEEGENEEPTARVLRRIFDEYDRSHPPVQPPVPYDAPLIPSIVHSKSYTGDEKKDAKLSMKKLKEDDVQRILDGASNKDTLQERGSKSPFLSTMRHFERQKGKGCNITEIADRRAGIWIFLYAVMQALPMLVVDAPGVRFSDGVEYFLCEPPRSGVPWASGDPNVGHGRTARSWYGIMGSQGVVSLPSDLIEHGVEGIYRRSHCWLRAAEWSGGMDKVGILGDGVMDEPQSAGGAEEPIAAPRISADARGRLAPVPPVITDSPNPGPYSPGLQPPLSAGARTRSPSPGGEVNRFKSRSSSADPHRNRQSVMNLGLEALPLPAGVSPTGGHSDYNTSRPNSATLPPPRASSRGPSSAGSGMTFDDIIGGMGNQQQKKEKRKSTMGLPIGRG
ncbi:MAG: hypothetical protein M1831_001083 [Alyxoria varia]|nr:MAG: hypothetical protein M1831_001083 [Alyxoria varia]